MLTIIYIYEIGGDDDLFSTFDCNFIASVVICCGIISIKSPQAFSVTHPADIASKK